MTTKRPKWKVKQTADKQWMLTLFAANGEALVWSESYTTKASAERAHRAVVRAALEATVECIKP